MLNDDLFDYYQWSTLSTTPITTTIYHNVLPQIPIDRPIFWAWWSMFDMCQCWWSEWITCVILFYSHHNRNTWSVTLPTGLQRKSLASITTRTTTTPAQQASFGFRIGTQNTSQLSNCPDGLLCPFCWTKRMSWTWIERDSRWNFHNGQETMDSQLLVLAAL